MFGCDATFELAELENILVRIKTIPGIINKVYLV